MLFPKNRFNKLTIDSTSSVTDLCFLGVLHPTDKSPYSTKGIGGYRHPYTAVYDLLFSTLRYKKINIGEIGIWDNQSMICWRNFFPQANLYGWDISEQMIEKAHKDNVFAAFYDVMDVKSESSIKNGLGKYGIKYDILIDDSTHIFEDQIKLIKISVPYLNPGAFLIVEDIFKSNDEMAYFHELSGIEKYFQNITFIDTEHSNKMSAGWDNDKLLVLVRNDVIYS